MRPAGAVPGLAAAGTGTALTGSQRGRAGRGDLPGVGSDCPAGAHGADPGRSAVGGQRHAGTPAPAGRRGRTRRLVIVGIYRSDEVGRRHPLRKLRNELRRANLLREFAVNPLDAAETAALAACWGQPPGPACWQASSTIAPTGFPCMSRSSRRPSPSGAGCGRVRTGSNSAPAPACQCLTPCATQCCCGWTACRMRRCGCCTLAAVAGSEFDLALVAGLAGGPGERSQRRGMGGLDSADRARAAGGDRASGRGSLSPPAAARGDLRRHPLGAAPQPAPAAGRAAGGRRSAGPYCRLRRSRWPSPATGWRRRSRSGHASLAYLAAGEQAWRHPRLPGCGGGHEAGAGAVAERGRRGAAAGCARPPGGVRPAQRHGSRSGARLA